MSQTLLLVILIVIRVFFVNLRIYTSVLLDLIHNPYCSLVHICTFEVIEKAIIHTVLCLPTLRYHRSAV